MAWRKGKQISVMCLGCDLSYLLGNEFWSLEVMTAAEKWLKRFISCSSMKVHFNLVAKFLPGTWYACVFGDLLTGVVRCLGQVMMAVWLASWPRCDVAVSTWRWPSLWIHHTAQLGCQVLQATWSIKHLNDDHCLVHFLTYVFMFLILHKCFYVCTEEHDTS